MAKTTATPPEFDSDCPNTVDDLRQITRVLEDENEDLMLENDELRAGNAALALVISQLQRELKEARSGALS